MLLATLETSRSALQDNEKQTKSMHLRLSRSAECVLHGDSRDPLEGFTKYGEPLVTASMVMDATFPRSTLVTKYAVKP
jgi:hypothetical protein